MSKKFSATSLSGKLHYHGCCNCDRRYTCSCQTPAENGMCGTCRTGRLSVHQLGVAPVECCFTECRITNDDDRKTYKLAGPGHWFICRTCARQHPRDPRSTINV